MTEDRRIELEIEVPGTPEQVWEAIATGPGISAWMHPTEVDERVGGSFSFDMGSGMDHAGIVTGWDPPNRFAQETDWRPGGEGPARTLATEWTVEARSGDTCVVRMVMTGFGSTGEWDEEIEGMAEGMRLALRNLQRYLTHFPGQRGAWIRAFGSTRGQGWDALATALGLAGAAEGDRVATDSAPRISGVVDDVVDWKWHHGLLLRTDAPAPGIAFLVAYGEGGGATVQACVYGDGAAAVAAREEPAWQAWMRASFPR
jgi:uncharacterized protein YndB with AHSA1/START domain